MVLYHAYLNKHRTSTKEKNPTWSAQETNKHLTAEWKNMTKEAKSEYNPTMINAL